MEASTFVLRGLVVLDSEGRRIAARHYCDARGQSNAPSEASLEKAIASRAKSKESSTLPSEPDVDMISGFTVLHRSSGELQLAAIGAESENELVLANVVNCLTDSLATLLGSPLQRRAALENLDLLLVALDEICDNGIILETDSEAVAQRAGLRTEDAQDAPLAEQTLSQAIAAASDQLKKQLAG